VANPEEFKKLQQTKWIEEEQRLPNAERVAIHWRIANPSSKTQFCFASNFEEETRTTFVLPEDTSLNKSSQEGTDWRTVEFVFWHVSLLCSPQQLCAERLHARKWPRGRSGKSEHSFLVVSRSLPLNFTSTKSRYTNCQPRKRNKGLEYMIYSAWNKQTSFIMCS